MPHTNNLPDGVTLTEGEGGLPVVRVDSPVASGEVYLQGAQVTAWTPKTGPGAGESPLFVSEHAVYEAGRSVRGGVPLCAPWFGPGVKKDKPYLHGYFRISGWTLAEATSGSDGVTLRFTLDGADANVPEGEPGDVHAEYTVTFGEALSLTLSVTAGAEPLVLEDALHAYLSISDIREVRIEGLDGTRYFDKAPGGRAVNAQSGDLTFTRETDRVYATDNEVTLVDPGKGRRIVVRKEGSQSEVVWNPWEAKAADIDDLGDDEWPAMVCIEVGNALAKHVKLAPGETHTTSAVYAVEKD